MIFREKDFAKAEFRDAAEAAVEVRAGDCGRQDGGRFGPKNNCAADDGGSNISGGGGGSATSTRVSKDNSWKKSSGDASWDKEQMSRKSPVDGGESLSSLSIENTKAVSKRLDGFGVSLDDLMSLSGGIVRGGEVSVTTYGNEVNVDYTTPVDPEQSGGQKVTWSVSVSDYGNGNNTLELGGFYTPNDSGEFLDDGAQSRVVSLMMQGVITSLSAADKKGFGKAVTFAVGDASDPLKGYRLWPKFGFDGEVSDIQHKRLKEFAKIAVRGEDTPDWAADLIDAIDEADSNGEKVRVQEVIASREGQVWWDENGSHIELSLDFKDKTSAGYKRFQQTQKRLARLKDRNQSRSLSPFDLMSVFDEDDDEVEVRAADCGRDDGGQFEPKNDCASEDGPVEEEVKSSKKRNVDVMIGGGKRVAVMDAEAKQRAVEDSRDNPKPEGSAPGSTTDLWDRDFVVRGDGAKINKISGHSPVFPPETHRQNGQFVAHEAVGQFLADRHEDQRRAVGAEGPGAIIDTMRRDLPKEQMDYIVDSLAEDAIHAYEVLQVDPGFYGDDLGRTMETMSQRHPELASDENAKFMFTMLTAITSSGQGPDANLADADALYSMWKQHGTVVPSSYGGGARDATKSLRTLQGLVDSFGVERTRRLLSGYTSASNINETFKRLAEKSADPNWKGREGETTWELPSASMVSGELVDEVVPVAAIFGPKIGSFYANLSGRHDFLTMDRWLMRSVGRVTGELLTRSTPDQAKRRADAALMAIESGKWKKDFLFGVDKKHGITKADLVRSLKIQAKTGVIEENGAAYTWAIAAERSHQKTPKSDGGQYGKHQDPVVHALHQAGNSMFKSLIHEQQDPRGGAARRNIREVFRQIQDRVEQKSGRRPDVDEIQAALWQYEKTLWKHLGAKGKIEKDSLFSSAATGLQSGKIKTRTFTPASRRDAGEQSRDFDDDDFDVYQHDAEQTSFMSDLEESGVDVVEWLAAIEDDIEERRNFAPLFESRDDCGRQGGGRFGPKNNCAADDGGSNISGGGTGTATASSSPVDSSWLEQDRVLLDDPETIAKHPPFTGAEGLKEFSVDSVPRLKKAMSLIDGIKSFDDVIAVGGGPRKGASIFTVTNSAGDIDVTALFPVSNDENVSRGEIETSVVIQRDEDTEVVTVNYSGLDLSGVAREFSQSPDGEQDSPDRRRISSILMERMTESLAAAERIGASRAETFAAGRRGSSYQGYRLWPQFGFDGDLPSSVRELLDSDIEDGSFKLSDDQAEKHRATGQLSIQELISTKAGDDWWSKNGKAVGLSIDFSDKESLGYKRFEKMKSLLPRLKRRNEGRNWTPADELEFRADCDESDRQPGGLFGPGNDCGSGSGSGGGGAATASPPRDDSWVSATSVSRVWSGKEIAESPPVTGGEVMKKIAIGGGVSRIRQTMDKIPGLDSLDEVAAIAGGVRKGGVMAVSPGYGNSLEIKSEFPVDIENDTPKTTVRTHVTVYPPAFDGEQARIDYETFAPAGTGTYTLSGAAGSRVTSILMQKMIESLEVAEKGQMLAETFGAGSIKADTLDGYRLWMRFGFDAQFADTKARRISEAASSGALTLDDEQQKSLKEGRLTLQELVATPAGEKWWIRNGTGITMTIDFSDKSSLGYKRYLEMKKLLPALRRRNESRSLEEWLEGADSRSADCGRVEGGKFGPKNQCQDDGSGGGGAPAQATASPDDGIWSSNANASWDQGGDDPPFDGADRFKSVSVAAPQKVSESLDEFGVTASDAASLVSSLENGNVSIRPAPEFKRGGAFGDSSTTPILFAFDGDVAGVKGAIEGSSALGLRREPDGSESLHLYQSTITVSKEVRQDATKRHAAARAFYTAMVNSVENARRIGVTKVTMNASGEADPQVRDHAPFGKGYTIWPRMGFDAPIPPDIARKLPSSLSHAKSLLDLHATPEGTRWWAANGVDVDVSLDLTDPSSPQNQVFDRFVRKFSTNRREMPLGSGDDWLSPEDLLRLDELWGEVWDDGLLDDYEWVEKRSADCGRDDGGRFDEGNQCQRAASQVARIARSGASHEELTSAIAEAIGTKRGWFSGPEPAKSQPSAVCEALGLKVANDWMLDKNHAEQSQSSREAIARSIAEAYAATQAVPSLKDGEFHIQTITSIAKHTGSSPFEWFGVLGVYRTTEDSVHIIADGASEDMNIENFYKTGYSSTPSPAHALVHEKVHQEHYANMIRVLKSPRPPQSASSPRKDAWAIKMQSAATESLLREADEDPDWLARCEPKVSGLGFYATTDPFEFVAEYSTAVKLGYAKNDPDLDRMCKAMLAPVPRKSRSA